MANELKIGDVVRFTGTITGRKYIGKITKFGNSIRAWVSRNQPNLIVRNNVEKVSDSEAMLWKLENL